MRTSIVASLFLFSYFDFGLVNGFIGNDIFQTGDDRLLDLFCVKSAEQLQELGQKTSTHKTLTENGIASSLIQLMLEQTPDFVPPDYPTLSQLFQSYYGECSSPDRFLEAVNDIVTANVEQDIQPGLQKEPSLHFDAESFLDAQRILFLRDQQINSVADDGKYATARSLIGQSLHAIQKFYAHSNWIELGNQETIDLIFGELGNIADEQANTCNPDDCTEGDCSNNIITNGLTSGYFHFNELPEGVKKCGHGSSLDNNKVGGINKDTPSQCFSPHHDHHKTASTLAEQATFEYLETIRKNVGNDAFKGIFALGSSSALAVVLDTSKSMGDEIEAVKQEILDIIDIALAGGITPSEYILAPYESTVNLTVTQDTDEVQDVLEQLYPSGGTEYTFSAFQAVLSNAPSFTDVLTFTDEEGDDPELVDYVIALAKEKQIKINVIWTAEGSTCPIDLLTTAEQTGGACVLSSNSDANDIVKLLSESIKSTRATISLTQEMTGSKDTSIYVDNSLDNSEYRTGVRVSGALGEASLVSPKGDRRVDMFDDSEIAANSDLKIDIIFRGNGLLEFTFKPDKVGEWMLETNPSSGQSYNIEVTASCTFNFLPSFEVLFLNSTHPSMKKIKGQPVTNSAPYISVQMTAVNLQRLESIDKITLVTPQGVVLHSYSIEFPDGLRENFIIDTEDFHLPGDSFFLELSGKDSGGNTFKRLSTLLVTPASTSIEITASSAQISAAPCESTDAEFIVINHGEPATIETDVTDELGFYTGSPDTSFFLGKDERASLITEFTVDCDAAVGDSSDIVVTATSSLDFTQNSAFAVISVISDEEDLTPPSYEIIDESFCTSDSSGHSNCHREWWFFEAEAEDLETGMRLVKVDVQADEDQYEVVIDDFNAGTNETINVRFEASCCVRKALLRLMDVAGNGNQVSFDQGPLTDCGRLAVKEVEASYLQAEWSCPCSDWVCVDKYNFLLVAQDGTQADAGELFCPDCQCEDRIDGLRACVTYNMTLTAKECVPGTETEDYVPAFVTTLEQPPSDPVNVRTVGKTTTSLTLQWQPNSFNKECVHKYKVCHRLLPDSLQSKTESEEECDYTPVVTDYTATLEYVVPNLKPCGRYRFGITAVTLIEEYESNTVYHEDQADLAVPGPPTSFAVFQREPYSITIVWNKPEINPLCVREYDTAFSKYDYDEIDNYKDLTTTTTTEAVPVINMLEFLDFSGEDPGPVIMDYFEDEVDKVQPKSNTVKMPVKPVNKNKPLTLKDYDFSEVISGLDACSYYNFSVYSNGFNDIGSSESMYTFGSTRNTQDLGVPTEVDVNVNQTSARISWFPPEKDVSCVTNYTVDYFNLADTSETGSVGVGVLTLQAEISGLKPCSHYQVSVTAWAQDVTATSQTKEIPTEDTAPDKPVNLNIDSTTSDGFNASWCEPLDYPQCAETWDWNTNIVKGQGTGIKIHKRDDGCQTVEQTKLKCNTKFQFTVWAISPHDIKGANDTRVLTTDPCKN